jgi:hypothetical protein
MPNAKKISRTDGARWPERMGQEPIKNSQHNESGINVSDIIHIQKKWHHNMYCIQKMSGRNQMQ